MTPLEHVDPDVDGDGVLDGYDDQDHDGWSNIDERSRSALPAAPHPAYAGQTGLDGLYIAVNPYNPCLPDINSRACTLHPPFPRELGMGTVRRHDQPQATRRTVSSAAAARPRRPPRQTRSVQGAGGNPGAFVSRSLRGARRARRSHRRACAAAYARAARTQRSTARRPDRVGSAETAIRAARRCARPARSARPRGAQVAERAAQQALGLGPLEPLLREPGVDEVLVSGTRPIWIERGGRLERRPAAFSDRGRASRGDRAAARTRGPPRRRGRADLRRAAARRLARQRRPAAARRRRPGADDPPLSAARAQCRAISCGSAPDRAARATCSAPPCAARLNVLVCGATGSGKTTTLGALGGMIGAAERIVTIEDTAELRLDLPHVVRLEARPASVEGRGEVTIRALVRTRCACGPTGSSSARSAGPRRTTCSPRSRPGTTARCRRSTPARRPRRCAGSRRSR